MDSRQRADVQAVIVRFDNTVAVLAATRPLLTRLHLKFLSGRIAASHVAIADALAAQLESAGLAARRGTGAMSRLRARAECWMVVSRLDIELACLECIARHGAGSLRRLRAISATLPGPQQNLEREMCRLERDLGRVESVLSEMKAAVTLQPDARIAEPIPAGRRAAARSDAGERARLV